MKHQLLIDLNACEEAQEWAARYETLQAAWDACDRGHWMLWLAGHLSGPQESDSRRTVVLATSACARLALPFVRKGDEATRRATETIAGWAKKEEGVTTKIVSAAGVAYATVAAARPSTLRKCADIVRGFYPTVPAAQEKVRRRAELS